MSTPETDLPQVSVLARDVKIPWFAAIPAAIAVGLIVLFAVLAAATIIHRIH